MFEIFFSYYASTESSVKNVRGHFARFHIYPYKHTFFACGECANGGKGLSFVYHYLYFFWYKIEIKKIKSF